MSIKENVKDILIPSEEDTVNMYPMDFEEFLWAIGNETMMPFIQTCYKKQEPMGQALHRKAMDLFRQYMIVGGMPQAVEAYVKSKDFNEVDRIKRRILKLYRDDIIKHANKNALKVEAIYDEIPSQLKIKIVTLSFLSWKKVLVLQNTKSPFLAFWRNDCQ